MALIQYYDVPQNSFITISLPRVAYGLRIENNSNQFINVKDDLGHVTAACPPGISAAWNALEGMHSPQIGCLGFYQGNARVYFFDSQVDTNSNPALQQPPGSVTTTDALAEQVLTAIQTLLGVTNTNTGGTTTNTASLVTLLNALNNLVTTTNTLDTDIRTYIDALRGMLAQSVTQLVFTGVWQEQSIGPLTHSADQVSIAVIYPPSTGNDGFLWIYYTYAGVRVYLEEKTYWFFAGGQQTPTLPTWITYDEKIPANATVVVGSDSSSTILVKI